MRPRTLIVSGRTPWLQEQIGMRAIILKFEHAIAQVDANAGAVAITVSGGLHDLQPIGLLQGERCRVVIVAAIGVPNIVQQLQGDFS